MKTKKKSCFENYPISTVTASLSLEIAIYLAGAYIVSLLGLAWMMLYLFLILLLQFKLLKTSCVNCCYYGRMCFSGKGKLSGVLFKKGDPKKFSKRQISASDLIPDFLISLGPVIIGIVLLVMHFNWTLLFAVLLLLVLGSWGNGFIRSNLACPNCKQRKAGCPAERLFSNRKH